jgi:hypothetical protein
MENSKVFDQKREYLGKGKTDKVLDAWIAFTMSNVPNSKDTYLHLDYSRL